MKPTAPLVRPPNRLSIMMRRLIMGVVLLNMLVGILVGFTVYNNHQQYEERAKVSVQNLSQLLSQDISRTFSLIDLSLENIAEELESQLIHGGIDLKNLHHLLAQQHSKFSDVDTFFITNGTTEIAHSTRLTTANTAHTLLNRDYLYAIREKADTDLVILKPVINHISGQLGIIFARRFNMPNGHFSGAVVATLPLKYLENTFSKLNLSRAGAISLRNTDLELFARYPVLTNTHNEKNIGSNTVSLELKNALFENNNSGVYFAKTAMDHIDRMNAYIRVPNYPFYVLVGFASDDYLKAWREESTKIILLAGILMLATIIFTLFIYRIWKAREEDFVILGHQENKFRRLLDSAPDAMFLLNQACCITMMNKQARRLISLPNEHIIGQDFKKFLPSFDHDTYEMIKNIHLFNDKKQHLIHSKDFTFIKPNGEEVSTLLSISPLETENGSIAIVTLRDISDRKEHEEALQLAAMVYRAVGEAIMVVDDKNRVVAVNPAFTKMMGYLPEDVIGHSSSFLKSNCHDSGFYREMWHTLENVGVWKGEILNRHKDGQIYAEWLIINTIYDDHGEVSWRVAMYSSVTDQKRAEETIWKQANYDPLTNLPNRRLFYDRLKQEAKFSRREKHSIALFILDLDHFKEVNDTLGHQLGDVLLIEAAKRIRACIRETDTAARMGGDEFTVILSGLENATNAEIVAHSIVKILAEPFQLGKEIAYVSASIGIAFYPNDTTDIDDLIKYADQAMYESKAKGRDCFTCFTPLMQKIVQERTELGHELRKAVSEKQFLIHFQPIVKLSDGSINKVEALLRWNHPKRGLLLPGDFIELAEELGLMNEISNDVFEMVAIQNQHWETIFSTHLEISINQSHRHLLTGNSQLTWINTLEKMGLSGEKFMIEVHEDSFIENNPEIDKKLQAFHEHGMHIVIDNFGSGMAALSCLRQKTIDYLKIDRSLITSAYVDQPEIIEALIAMAHKLDIKVIAEGIETTEQYELLKKLGCDFAQGYLFSKPLPADLFTNQFLKSKTTLLFNSH
jgi:diguanylate cyclase (GGDEF)-like protein/PAS domain S-box-containing protein